MRGRPVQLAVFVVVQMVVLVGLHGALSARPAPFVAYPYLQLGTEVRPDTLDAVWITTDDDASWSVQAERARCGPVRSRRLVVLGRAYRQCSASMTARGAFEYQVIRNGETVFTARAQAPPRPGASIHVALMGDVGTGNEPQRALARVLHRDAPSLVLVAGDVVYPRGQQADALRNIHGVYNTEGAGGAPIMRAVPFVAAPGNHDVPGTSVSPVQFDKLPDALAWFYDWLEPMNGPPVNGPKLGGPVERIEEMRLSAGERFPRMGSFSFDWGCAHWLVLDSNRYNDWTDPALRHWVAADLAAAQGAAWRFVVLHHPPFQSGRTHQDDQWTRTLCDVFEKGRVAVVFAGHVHNYQRSRPLRFTPRRQSDGRWVAGDGRVDGTFIIDEAFDGSRVTRPSGVVYVVTGAGGASRLYPMDPLLMNPYTALGVVEQWSFTDLRVEPRSVIMRQLGAKGQELDRITITP